MRKARTHEKGRSWWYPFRNMAMTLSNWIGRWRRPVVKWSGDQDSRRVFLSLSRPSGSSFQPYLENVGPIIGSFIIKDAASQLFISPLALGSARGPMTTQHLQLLNTDSCPTPTPTGDASSKKSTRQEDPRTASSPLPI